MKDPKAGDKIFLPQGQITFVDKIKGYRTGGIFVIKDDYGVERMIRPVRRWWCSYPELS